MYQTEEIGLFYMIEKKGQIYEMIYVIDIQLGLYWFLW